MSELTSSSPMGNVPMGTIIAFVLSKNNIPLGWLECNGKPIPPEYEQLSTLLNGYTPNLCGYVLVGTGKSPLSGNEYQLAKTGGEEMHTLTQGEMPEHVHPMPSYNEQGNNISQNGQGISSPDVFCWQQNNTTAQAGGSLPHNNMQPYYPVHYIIYAGIPSKLKDRV